MVFLVLRQPNSSTTCRPGLRPVSCSSIDTIPNELVLGILRWLGLHDLLAVSLVNARLYQLSLQVLAEHLADPCAGTRLRFFFDQESRWRFSIDMVLERNNSSRSSSTFTFIPVRQRLSFRCFNSKVLRNPNLYEMALVDGSPSPQQEDVSETLVLDSLLSRSLRLDIKQGGGQQYDKYMDGRLAMFSYRVHNTPTHRIKSRPGERWLQPVGFECDPWWLVCPRKSGGLMRFMLPSRGLVSSSPSPLHHQDTVSTPPSVVRDALASGKRHAPAPLVTSL